VKYSSHRIATSAPDAWAVVYNPTAEYSGPDQFLYTISDGNGGTAAAAVVVNVGNDASDRLEVVPSVGLVTFTEHVPPPSVPITLDAGVRVGAGLEGVMTGATVKFAGGFVPRKDILKWTPLAGVPIKGKFNPAKGVLRLTGA